MALSMSTGGGGMPLAVQATPMPRMKAAPKGNARMGANAASLGADVVNGQKTKLKSLKKNTAHLPIVCIDIYGADNAIAYQPPAVVTETIKLKNGKTKATSKPIHGAKPTYAGCLNGKGSLFLKGNDEVAYKAMKRLVKKGGHGGNMEKVLSSAVASVSSVKNNDELLEVYRPANLLGSRCYQYVQDCVIQKYKKLNNSDSSSPGIGVNIKEQALDGTKPTGDDFDRVTFSIKMVEDKNDLSLLPEELVSIMVAQGKRQVQTLLTKANEDGQTNESIDENNDVVMSEELESFPVAVAVPGWCSDAAIEAAIEACGTREQYVYQRGVCAMVSVISSKDNSKDILPILAEEIKKGGEDEKGATKINEQPLVLLAGLTPEGIELYIFRVGNVQQSSASPLGSVTAITSKCFQSSNPLHDFPSALQDLMSNLDLISPKRKPCVFVTYGSTAHQGELQAEFRKIRNSLGLDEIPMIITEKDVVSNGACALAADDHGRLDDIFLKVKNISTCSVGLRYTYFSENEDDSMDPIVSTIFDFDRKLPVSPYIVELSAAECACVRKEKSDEVSVEAIQSYEGGKYVPLREAAAKALSIQIVQKTQHDSDWIPIGKIMNPLCIEGDSENEQVGCESVTLRVFFSVSGLISVELDGDRQSVMKALQEKRKSKITYYVLIIAATLYLGGFMVKSWYEEYRFDADTEKLLRYYKFVAPGSLADGDLNQARYLVWKYRGRTEKLWKRLEIKYGVSVEDVPDFLEESEEEDEVVDMDRDESNGAQEDDL